VAPSASIYGSVRSRCHGLIHALTNLLPREPSHAEDAFEAGSRLTLCLSSHRTRAKNERTSFTNSSGCSKAPK
jgi:hypothetical protein